MIDASRSRRRWYSIVALALLLGYLLLPLTSESWEIEEEEIDAKLDYLAAERSLARRGAASRARPRVILIVADDLALVDVSRYAGTAGTPNTPTPAIDRIGEEGATFTQAHATATVCAPSRAALLTGRYQ
ncbi:MAG: sulfatase-like hydrolase/transferase, partial [Spirochaetota bacterium]